MTFRSFVASAFVTIAAVGAMHAQAPATDSWIEVTEKVDWGKVDVPASGHLESNLYIVNKGKTNVKVVEVRPGCGCTKTDPDKTELKPGEKSTVGIKLNISPQQMGNVTKSVTVRVANDKDTVTKIVMLHADVQRLLSIGPNPWISFTDLQVGKTSTVKATLSVSGEKPVTISDVAINGGLVTSLTNGTVVRPGQSVEISVSSTPTVDGNVSGTLTFKGTNGTKTEDFTMSAYGQVKAVDTPKAADPKSAITK